jgi:hypothetical protein
MASINYTRPFLYPYQSNILDSVARFTVTEAATKVGKTASHIIWLFEQALACKKGQAVWWVAPSIGQAKMAYDRMKAQITNKDVFTSNETHRTITLKTGAKIEFKTAEKPDNLYGDDVYAFVFDEFTRAREGAWHALRSTITSTGGKGKFIGNVKGRKNWGHKMAMKAKTGDDPNYAYFKITAYDAANAGMLTKDGRPFIEEIESAKVDLPESVFKELYLAEASEDGSNPFGIQFIQQCVYPISTHPAVAFGGDLAKSVDWTVEIGLDKFGSTCHFRRYQMDWRSTISNFVALPPAPTRMDSTGVGDPIVEAVQAVRPNVFGFKFTQYSKQQLMEGLALGIQQRKLSFPPGIIVDELESFEYEYTRTGVRYTAPDGMTDDCVCALALAYAQWLETGTGGISWI